MEIKSLVVILCAGAVIGVAAALINTYKKEKAVKKLKPFDEMFPNSLAVESIDGHMCSEWFREKASGFKGDMVGLLLYPNEELINSMGYECPEKSILQNYVLQLLTKKDSEDLLAYRLINYVEIRPELKEKLDEKGAIRVNL